MKGIIFILFASFLLVHSYDRGAVVNYAGTFWNSPNHDCNSGYTDCTPYSYWGGDNCNYGSHGGDCANFVSQSVLAGGHSALVGGECRGYPCGVEEVGATRLGNCLRDTFGWESNCGYLMGPPGNIQAGDVLVYHAGSCDDYTAHAVVVVEGGGDAKIACHSSNHYGIHYTYIQGSRPYFQWLHFPG